MFVGGERMRRGGFGLNAGLEREWLQFRCQTGLRGWKRAEANGIHVGSRRGCADDSAQKGGVT